MRRFVRRLAFALATVLLGCALMFGYLGYLQISGNFHPVIPGELYRSAQPTPEGLRQHREAVGIRSIINLRGENGGLEWYDNEVAAAEELGLIHLDFRMSARRILSKEDASVLVELMRSAPKPVLIHCQGGADRSGLAAALFLAAITGSTESRAEGQISLRYGHIGVPYLSAAFPMNESWESFEPWLGFEDS